MPGLPRGRATPQVQGLRAGGPGGSIWPHGLRRLRGPAVFPMRFGRVGKAARFHQVHSWAGLLVVSQVETEKFHGLAVFRESVVTHHPACKLIRRPQKCLPSQSHCADQGKRWPGAAGSPRLPWKCPKQMRVSAGAQPLEAHASCSRGFQAPAASPAPAEGCAPPQPCQGCGGHHGCCLPQTSRGHPRAAPAPKAPICWLKGAEWPR